MQKLPKHIAFIMDGNGRWAKSKGATRSVGHQKGVNVMKDIVTHCFDLGIEVVSLFAFSSENWARSKDEVDELFDLIRRYLKTDVKNISRNKKIRFTIMGDISKLPDDIRQLIDRAARESVEFKGGTLNIGLNYGGRQEILRAVNNLVQSGIKNIDNAMFERFLYTNALPELDMLVRTSGEMRISNFMLYQMAYTELFFTKTLWPDFTAKELDKLLVEYSQRNRRFGAIEENN